MANDNGTSQSGLQYVASQDSIDIAKNIVSKRRSEDQKQYDEGISNYKEEMKKAEREIQEVRKQLKKAQNDDDIKKFKELEQQEKQSIEGLKRLRADLDRDKEQREKKQREDEEKFALKIEEMKYEKMTLRQKQEYAQQQQKTAEQERQNQLMEQQQAQALGMKEEEQQAQQRVAEAEKQASQWQEKSQKLEQQTNNSRISQQQQNQKAYEQRQEQQRQEADALREQQMESDNQDDAGELLKGQKKKDKEQSKLQKKQDNAEQVSDWKENVSKQLDGWLSKSLAKIGGAVDNVLKTNMSSFQEYFSKWNTVLQGTNKSYESISKIITSNLGSSPFVSQANVFKKVDEMLDKGIAYNVEQRAFLSTVSDRVQKTFDAQNGTLLRIIRIQQQDSTQARLGMESYLTKFLNTMFNDTSYLAEDISESVSQNLIDVNSQYGYEDSQQFEYAVQKWLGSLYSVGVSNQFVSSIATGINQLGTGNVDALSSNSALQTLFAMSQARGDNTSYSDMLVNGVSSSQVSTLLKNMVLYLQEVGRSDNQVIKSQYGSLLGLSMSDLQAIQNLSPDTISVISNSNIGYGDMYEETKNQLSTIGSRTHISNKIDNVINNSMFTMAEGVQNNTQQYAMWKIADVVQSVTGGIKLPQVHVLGNAVDLSAFTIEGLIKTGAFGIGAIGQLSTVLSSFKNAGRLDIDNWGQEKVITQGTGFVNSRAGGIESGTSSSMVVSGSGEDIEESQTASQRDNQRKKEDKYSQTEQKDTYNVDDLFRMMFVDGNMEHPIYVKSDTTKDESIVDKLYDSLFENRKYVKVQVMNTSDLATSMQDGLYGQDTSTKSKNPNEQNFTLNDLINALMMCMETQGGERLCVTTNGSNNMISSSGVQSFFVS